MDWLIVDADTFDPTIRVNQSVSEGRSRRPISRTNLLAKGEAFLSTRGLSRQPCEPICQRSTSSRGRPAPP